MLIGDCVLIDEHKNWLLPKVTDQDFCLIGNIHYIFDTEDTVNGKPANLKQKFTIIGMSLDSTHRLSNWLSIMIGIKTMVTMKQIWQMDPAELLSQ